MFLAAVIMVAIGVFGIPVFASILKLNIRHIIPVVLMCSLIGAYSVTIPYMMYRGMDGIFGVYWLSLGFLTHRWFGTDPGQYYRK